MELLALGPGRFVATTARRRALWLALVLGACGGEPAPGVDAGDAGPADAGALDALDPAAPVLTPCPAGWREVVGSSGITSCDPWPERGPPPCAPAEFHLPGTATCTPIGSACAADGWPTGLPASGVFYVDPLAPRGGDGTTPDTAFATLHDAIAAVPDGATLALRAGLHDEASSPLITVGGAITIVGACASGTVVQLPPDPAAGGLALGTDAAIRDVTISSGLLIAGSGRTVIEHSVIAVVDAPRGTLEVSHAHAFGIVGRGDATVSLAGVVVDEVSSLVGVGESATLTATDVVVAQLSATDDASLTLSRSVLGVGGIGTIGSADARSLTMTDCVVSQDRSGLKLRADVRVTRTRFHGLAGEYAILTDGPAILTDVIVEDVGGEAIPYGLGIAARGSEVTLSRVAIAGTGIAALVGYEGATITARDLRIDGVRSRCEDAACARGPLGGFGIAASASAIDVARFATSATEVCAVVVDVGGAIDLASGWIDDAPVGACVQQSGFDLSRLQRGVEYRPGVVVPVQATTYDLPPPPP